MSEPDDTPPKGLPEIDIPESATRVKPWFVEWPDEAVVEEILAFINAGNPTYLCRYHTHTRPPEDAPVEYLGVFHIPDDQPEAPCPCCRPRHPKFRYDGKIAWFRDEAVIRLIGGHCFKRLNPEGHEAAIGRYKQALRQKQNLAYLLRNPQAVSAARKAIKDNLPIALAVDTMRGGVLRALSKHKIHLWGNVRGGALKQRRNMTSVRVGSDGRASRRSIATDETYATIRGHLLLNPLLEAFAHRYQEIDQLLASIDFEGEHETRIKEATHEERHRVAHIMADGIARAVQVTEELAEVRQFFSVTTINTLRTWGQLDGASCELFLERDAKGLLIGAHEYDTDRIPWEKAVEVVPETVPTIGGIAD